MEEDVENGSCGFGLGGGREGSWLRTWKTFGLIEPSSFIKEEGSISIKVHFFQETNFFKEQKEFDRRHFHLFYRNRNQSCSQNAKIPYSFSSAHNFEKTETFTPTRQAYKSIPKHKTMSLLRYDPFASVFDDAFDHTPFFRNTQLTSHKGGWEPTGMRSREDNKNYVFQVDVPGVSPDDLKMKLDDSHRGHMMIHLSGERKFQSEDGSTFESSSFERRFTIGPNVDKEKIGADLKDGVLTITVPKKEVEEPSPTYIPITSAGTEKSSE